MKYRYNLRPVNRVKLSKPSFYLSFIKHTFLSTIKMSSLYQVNVKRIHVHSTYAHTSTKRTNTWPTYMCLRCARSRIKDSSRLRCLQGLGYSRTPMCNIRRNVWPGRSTMETARGNLPFIYIAIVCNPFLPCKVTQPLVGFENLAKTDTVR